MRVCVRERILEAKLWEHIVRYFYACLDIARANRDTMRVTLSFE